MNFIGNARMYGVTPGIEAAWQALLANVADDAGVALAYTPWPAPNPLEKLWARPDLGCVLMCGFPIALRLADVVPIAAAVPALAWAEGRAAYRSDFIVRRDSGFQTLEDTFGGHLGWTVAHSHSGFNAPRHHLLGFLTPERPRLYGRVTGNLVTARKVLDSVLAGNIDVGPLDAYWHALIALHDPKLVENIRVVDSTALSPIPAFVASPALGKDRIKRLRSAFAQADNQAWFPALAQSLQIRRFFAVEFSDFAQTLHWRNEAECADYTEFS